jgi:prepilin peptidase CpaA
VIATLLLVALVGAAAITDASRHRIYNWLTYPGMLAGLVLAAAGWLLESAAPETAAAWRPVVGWLDLQDALAGFLLCGAIMVVCFVFFPVVGGGDVKLLAMIGALAGLERGLEIMLWTFLFGGCVGLVILIWRLGLFALVRRAGQLLLGAATLGIWLKPPAEEQQTLKQPVFLGPCAAAALVAVLVPWAALSSSSPWSTLASH